MNQPLVSFITPIYNAEEYLPECVESVLRQTCRDWELILINDGSTDKSGVLCDVYAEKDQRIRVIHKENGGQFDARLKGIEAARGLYCMGLDADDWLEKDCVENLSWVLSIRKYDIISWNIRLVCNGGEVNSVVKDWYGEYTRDEFLEYVCRTTSHSFCDKAIRTEIIKRSFYGEIPLRIRYAEDFIMIAPSLCMASDIVVIDKSVYNYRHSDGSVTNDYSTRRTLDYLDAAKCIYGILSYYKMLSPRIIDIEYISLANSVGFCLKRAYRLKRAKYEEIEKIRSNTIYRSLAGYERPENMSFDIVVFMKLFRLRLDRLLTFIYEIRR